MIEISNIKFNQHKLSFNITFKVYATYIINHVFAIFRNSFVLSYINAKNYQL